MHALRRPTPQGLADVDFASRLWRYAVTTRGQLASITNMIRMNDLPSRRAGRLPSEQVTMTGLKALVNSRRILRGTGAYAHLRGHGRIAIDELPMGRNTERAEGLVNLRG